MAHIVKVQAHQKVDAIEGSLAKRRAQGNDRADSLAKQALQQHPRWSKQETAEAKADWEQAMQIAILTGRAIARWPKASRADKRPRSKEDAARKAEKAEQQQAARAAKEAAARAAVTTHHWHRWQGITRCTMCGIRREQQLARRPCDASRPHLCRLADEARLHGHERLQLAVMRAPSGETGLLLFCGQRWAFSQSGTKVTNSCSKSTSGRYALSRLHRGLHPRATAEWRGYQAVDLMPMQWHDESS